jgi:adenylosuccinate synthase
VSAAGAGKIGTTGRGIGPAYEDKVGRRAIRVCDLAHLDALDAQLDRLCAHHDACAPGSGRSRSIARRCSRSARDCAFRPPVRPAGVEALADRAQGRRADPVRRGAGRLLDVDHGTYPFVTSSNTVSGRQLGFGPGPSATGFVLGSSRPIPRAGSGPFPTELSDEVGQRLGERGHEFGDRHRAQASLWLVRRGADAPVLRHFGVTGIALTKLDVLDGFDKVKICTGYRLRGKVLDYYPAHAADQAEVEPIYEEMDGWHGTTAGARSWADLPAQAIKYIQRVQELIETPVALVSTSPEREDTILVRDPFLD